MKRRCPRWPNARQRQYGGLQGALLQLWGVGAAGMACWRQHIGLRALLPMIHCSDELARAGAVRDGDR